MANSIGAIADSLITELKTSGTVQGIRTFYKQSKSNLNLTLDNSSSENLKNIGILYILMLENDNFEDDPDERQLMAAIGYYVLSLGVNLNSDKIGIPTSPLEWIEFMKLRILLSLHSKASIKYSLKMRPDREVDRYWTTLSANPYQKEQEALTKMIVSDAAEIERWSESHLLSIMANVFLNEAMKLAKQIISNNSRIIQNSSLEEFLYSGKEVHKSLFSFLESRSKNKESITAMQFVDNAFNE
jgi:hypothetical protein